MSDEKPTPLLLDVDSASAYLGLPVEVIKKLLSENAIPYVEFEGVMYIPSEYIERWLNHLLVTGSTEISAEEEEQLYGWDFSERLAVEEEPKPKLRRVFTDANEPDKPFADRFLEEFERLAKLDEPKVDLQQSDEPEEEEKETEVKSTRGYL